MPKFSASKAASVNTNLESYPLVSATKLCEAQSVVQFFAKRTAKTEFGESMFVDFMYADDPYNEEGYRDAHYTTVFTVNSPAYRQLLAEDDLNYNDPLEAIIAPVGRSFKLIDPDALDLPPTSPQESKAVTPAPAPSRPAAAAGSRPSANTANTTRTAPPRSTIPGKDLPF